jgi:hypothetical protein
MQNLISEIQADIEWRVDEISNLKTIPIRYGMTKSHQHTLILSSIPSMYALWEGYLKTTFSLVTQFINKLNLKHSDVHVNLLTHSIDNDCNLSNERKNLDSKIKFIKVLSSKFNSPFVLSQGIPTESNSNYKTTNKILERFNINNIHPDNKAPLDKLLFFRNSIAHGENAITVERTDIDRFSLLIQNLMYEVLLLVEDCILNKRYLVIHKQV